MQQGRVLIQVQDVRAEREDEEQDDQRPVPEHVPPTHLQLHAARGALLGLLPRRAQAAALGQIDAVRRLSGMAPKRAQCLCFNLFKDELMGRTDAELAARVARPESYR